MANNQKKWKLGQLSREFNVSIDRIVEVLRKEGYKGYKGRPNEKVEPSVVQKLAKHFGVDKKFKSKLEEIRMQEEAEAKESLSLQDNKTEESVEPEIEEKIYIKDAASGTDIPVDKDIIEVKKDTESTGQKQEEQKTETGAGVDKTEEKKVTDNKKEEPQLKVVGEIDLEEVEKKAKPKRKSTGKKRPKAKSTTSTGKEETSETKDNILERIEQISQDLDKETTEKDTKQQPDAQEAGEQIKQPEVEAAQKEQQTVETEKLEQTKEQPEEKENRQVEEKEKEKQIGITILGQIELPDDERGGRRSSRKSKDKANKTSNKANKDNSKNRQDKGAQNTNTVSKSSKRRSRSDRRRRVERVNIEEEARRIHDRPRKRRRQEPVEIDQKDIDRSYRETLASAANKTGKSIAKKRQEKKKQKQQKKISECEQQQNKRLTITEFLTIGQLAALMGVDQIELLQKALSLGIKATVNYPLEADDIELLAGEFGFEVDFIDVTTLEELEAQFEDKEENLVPRPPIVTVMGHVDHGKTSLLDYIRKTNVVAGEAGGITQHIGAYHITLDDGRKITFIDTPGHEAFTAMRARGAKVTDIAVIVIAADDGVRPQTEEALDHAKAAGVPIIFAINKVDKETADPEKIRNQLAQRGYLVSSWGGPYFDVEISAKTGFNIDELLETILLVAEDLDLKANPKRPAVGTILEASVEKGRGPVANLLVRTGTLKMGDIILAGSHYGRVRAMFNERMQRIKEAGPAIPAQILGLDGAPEPGEPFVVMSSEKEAKQKAQQRAQIKRIIERRKRKILTLEEISRRLQVGEFNEINVIIRADVQGTADALAEQLEKLSTDEVQVNVIRAATGQITESDVMLAQVSKAIIIGFNVRPSAQVRKLAEQKEVEIRTYSVIYHAIEEIQSAIAGMLKPIVKEEHLGTAKVLKIYKIKGVGTVAGCQVEEGKVTIDSKVRVVRNGIVVYEGELLSLKRYQSDVQEVKAPQECGMAIKNFNDIKKDDQIEAYREIEIERKI